MNDDLIAEGESDKLFKAPFNVVQRGEAFIVSDATLKPRALCLL